MGAGPPDPRWIDPVVIVTGGSYAAGRELARRLARRDFAIVVVYLGDQRAVQAVVEEILASHGTALAVRADIADELDVERLFDETTAALGHVDVVAHAARRDTSVVNRQAAGWLRQGGAIVTVSGAEALAPELAAELRARDITVNGLVAGLEPPGPDRDVADLVALLDRWRSCPGN